MNTSRKYNAPLTVPLVLVFGSGTLAITFAWIVLVSPRLLACLASLEDSSPVIYSLLRSLIAFMILPVIFVSVFLMVHFYQRYYDRKKQKHDA